MITKNKKAKWNYFLSNFVEAGIVLKGNEVKLIQAGKIDLTGSYVEITDNLEMFLLNSTIAGVEFSEFFHSHKVDDFSDTRPRKLLLHKSEIQKFQKLLVKGYTLLVTDVYANEKNRIKVTVALGKGKKDYDKRNTIKERDLSRI